MTMGMRTGSAGRILLLTRPAAPPAGVLQRVERQLGIINRLRTLRVIAQAPMAGTRAS
jgi:hypothetical protein